MQHFILRCKHCQKEYTYCTYGNGPEYGTEYGCSMDYCAECQKAIDNTFSAIPVKFKPQRKEINEPLLLELFSKIREEKEIEKNNTSFQFPIICSNSDIDNYDNIETYIHKNKKYQVKWDDNTPDEKHLFIFMEYDILNDKYTNRPWRYDEKDSYGFHRNLMKNFLNTVKKSISVKPMSEPVEKLFFDDIDIDWELNIPKPNKIDFVNLYEPQHILETHSLEDIGACIKSRVKNGFYKCKVKVKENINIDELIDYVDYKYTYEGYQDEDFVTITKIECV